MVFNKNLLAFSFVTCTMAISCQAMEDDIYTKKLKEVLSKIPDVSKILPPVEQYIAKMKDVTERYKDVFKEISETEAQQRIDKAKQEALNFYAEIFGVKPSEVEKYRNNFTTAQYLTWVAKEVINNGDYRFATTEEELILGSELLFGDEVSDEEKCYLLDCFSLNSANAFPSLEKVSELCKIRCMYNCPNFEALIVHETGHVLDYAYRALRNIRSKTMDPENLLLCEEAVSVFFETMYLIKNDRRFILEWLLYLYRISFEQAYVECIKKRSNQDKLHDLETYQKVSKLSNLVYYPPDKDFNTKNAEQFMNETAEKHPELVFIFELWREQAEKWGLDTIPLNKISVPSLPTTGIHHVLNIYTLGENKFNFDVTAVKIVNYVEYVPHAYRTLRISDNLNTSKNVLDALYKIVTNVPDIMTANELKDFISKTWDG